MGSKAKFALALGGVYLCCGLAFAETTDTEAADCTDAVCTADQENLSHQGVIENNAQGELNFHPPGRGGPGGPGYPPPGGGGYRPPHHRPGYPPPPPGGGGYRPPRHRPGYPPPPPPRGYFQCTLVASGYNFYGTGYSQYEAERNAFNSCYDAAQRWGRERECWDGVYYCDYR